MFKTVESIKNTIANNPRYKVKPLNLGLYENFIFRKENCNKIKKNS